MSILKQFFDNYDAIFPKEPWFMRCFILHLLPQFILAKGKAGVSTPALQKREPKRLSD